jgi:hypothetical protein
MRTTAPLRARFEVRVVGVARAELLHFVETGWKT